MKLIIAKRNKKKIVIFIPFFKSKHIKNKDEIFLGWKK